MGTGTLTDRSTSQTILQTFFNEIHAALNGTVVGRNSSGVATSGQDLGSTSLPWGTLYVNNLNLGGSAVDASAFVAPNNRIISGKKRSASNQPQFIDPNGAAASFVLEGNTTDLVVDINGTQVTVSTDITESSLTVGPSTTATALVNDSDAADQDSTRTWGEFGAEKETITVDTMGAEFQSFIGEFQIIQISGVATEYALAYVKSTTELTNVFRGWFTNSSGNPVNRTGFSNNDTITVLSTGWVFVENDGTTVDVSYTTPIYAFDEPGSPATGDYWYDLVNNVWKRYSGSSFDQINRTLVGVVGIDSSNCVCARSFDFYFNPNEVNTFELELESNTEIKAKYRDARISVYGNTFQYTNQLQVWDISSDLAASTDLYDATEQSSTTYYVYLKDTGEPIFQDISPQYRPDLGGWYSVHNPWRCIGKAFNNSSSNLASASNSPIDEINESGSGVAYFRHVVPSETTPEGIDVADTWKLRSSVDTTDLILDGDLSFCSISSGVITLQEGIYAINGSFQWKGVAGDNIHTRLYNTSDSAVAIQGGFTECIGAEIAISTISGVISVTGGPKTFELQGYTDNSSMKGGGVRTAAEGGTIPSTTAEHGYLRIEKRS